MSPKQDDSGWIEPKPTALLQEINAETMKDMGRAMAALKERFAGSMDFGKASGKIKELLSKK